MPTKIYDLKVKTGEYINKQGEKKGRYVEVGRIMRGDDGSEYIMLNRTFNPAGVPDLKGSNGDSIVISKFEPRDNQGSAGFAPAAVSPRVGPEDDSDIPF